MKGDITSLKSLINQAELARRLNVSKQYVSLLLSGKRSSADRMEQIMRILHEELCHPDPGNEESPIDSKS